jgi:protein TonB
VPSYRGTADRSDQAKAIAAVVAVHVALAFVILSGLNVRIVEEAVRQMKTFNIEQQPPPPPVPPPLPRPVPRPAMRKAAGAPAKKAEPTPVVAPPPTIPLPSPVPAARIAGAGSAPSSGAAASGSGTGAGGAGLGPGGGGYADYSRFTPARKLTKIPDREYRRLAASGIASGSVAITIRVNPDGSASNCRIMRSSGSSYADSLMCALTLQYVRFSPARDPSGRPVAQDVTWTPNWAPR